MARRSGCAGIRHSLARSFLAALEADFSENATDVIQVVRNERPLDYLKIVIGLLPNEIVNDVTGEMTNDERDELVGRIRDAIAARSEDHLTSQEEEQSQAELEADFESFAGSQLMIRSKSGEIKPLLFNPAQRHIHARIEAQRQSTGKVRALILKGRQQGCSTYVAARFYHRTTQTSGQRTFIRATERTQPLRRRRHRASRPPLAKMRPGRPAPAIGPGTLARSTVAKWSGLLASTFRYVAKTL